MRPCRQAQRCSFFVCSPTRIQLKFFYTKMSRKTLISCTKMSGNLFYTNRSGKTLHPMELNPRSSEATTSAERLLNMETLTFYTMSLLNLETLTLYTKMSGNNPQVKICLGTSLLSVVVKNGLSKQYEHESFYARNVSTIFNESFPKLVFQIQHGSRRGDFQQMFPRKFLGSSSVVGGQNVNANRIAPSRI